MHKDLKKIVEALEDQSFEVTPTARGHQVVRKDGARITTFSGTPGDGRSWKNSLAACKRAGFIWPPPRKKGG